MNNNIIWYNFYDLGFCFINLVSFKFYNMNEINLFGINYFFGDWVWNINDSNIWLSLLKLDVVFLKCGVEYVE